MTFSVSVIISTFDSPEWLERVLVGYGEQTDRDFQIVVADDGSSGSTREVIDRFRQSSGMNVEHVWHTKEGCQKSYILNKAVMRASGDYLIFTEGDCMPRKDFVSVHRNSARKGCFLAGGHTKLPVCCSERVTNEAVESGNAFDIVWLMAHGYPDYAKKLRLVAKGPWAKICNLLFRNKGDWNGHNSSGWKKDIVGVNGFDERIKHIGEDCEMGDRLKHAGIKVKRVRYTAVCVHLSPMFGIGSEEERKHNLAIKAETKRDRKRFTEYGIVNRARNMLSASRAQTTESAAPAS